MSKPGDRVLLVFDTSEDPCIMRTGNETHVEGYVSVYSERCRCRRSDFDYFAVVRLPLHIRGPLKTRFSAPPSLPSEDQLSFVYIARSL